ncbi:hypothetical protein QA612_01885 [Evansella sp. AB-P1]|uniref:DUF6944 family repetitive protein n=1 Tax=Evansella sp. AB-P1 TaxID=3037653 RepID=UPI0024204490|nr:hypothetical protein [Evansella sp. AB-P1]MDG5786223.1 hypothetical protein [Evansella sp. AB-P1]
MSKPILYIVGNWVEALGANIAAAGVSIEIQDSIDGKRIRVIGDSIQGLGNFMIAKAEMEDPLAEIGNVIQGIASTSNAIIAHREIYVDDKLNNQIEIISDSFQALGSYVTAVARSDENPPKAFGNAIQSVGAIIEAIGVLNILIDEETRGDQLRNIGKWIQGFGTVIQAISVTPGLKEVFSEEEGN